MKSLIEWFASNTIAGNLLMILLWVMGLIGFHNMRQEIIPQMTLNTVMAFVSYPGASPNSMEEQVLKPMEMALANLPHVKEMRSFTDGSSANITLDLSESSNVQEMQQQIHSRLQRIANWPDNIDKPEVVVVAQESDYVAKIVLHGNTDNDTLRRLASHVKEQLINEQQISQISIGGVDAAEVMIEVSAAMLLRYQLNLTELSGSLKQQLGNMVSGQVEASNGYRSILARGSVANLIDLEELVIRTWPDGSRLLLKDIATIKPSTASQQTRFLYQGQPAIYLDIYRQGKQNILDIRDATQQAVDRLNAELPPGIKAVIWQDMAQHYKSRINMMINDAWVSLLLVFFPLWLILKWRLAFWVCWDIPTAFLGAVALMPWLGVSFNMVSLFAFIMILGVVVDDSIVIGEHIHHYQLEHGPGVKTAAAATAEMATPVILSSLATIAMFLPLWWLPGAEGHIIRDIPIVVVLVLVVSLLEALFILPGHLANADDDKKRQENKIEKPSIALRAIEYVSARCYTPFLQHCLKLRYAVLMLFVSSMLVSLGLLAGQWIKVQLISEIAMDNIVARIELPEGTDVAITESITDQLYQSALQLEKDLQQHSNQAIFQSIVMMFGQEANHIGSIVIELKPSETRQINNNEIVDRWRKRLPESLRQLNISFETTLLKSGDDIDVQLLSKNPQQLQAAATALKTLLVSYPGAYDVADNAQTQQAEVQLTLNANGQQLGLNPNNLAQQVRQAFQSLPIMTLQQAGEPLVVRLGFPEHQQQLGNLEIMPITLMNEKQVPLQQVAKVELTQGPTAISRVQLKRALRVTAKVDANQVSAVEVAQWMEKDFLENLSQNYPEVIWQRAGLQQSQQEFLQQLTLGSILGLLAMYVLMALLFRSYWQPIMILSAVPFGWVGAILGHWWMDLPCTLMSMVGMTAVSGIVVNHNLVLVDCINRYRSQGLSMAEAIVNGARSRFCAIFLTSSTTVVGLIPLASQSSIQAQFLVPMAVSLAFGVTFATLVTWIFVPCCYAVLEDLHKGWSWLLKSPSKPQPANHSTTSGTISKG
jgi:multidrug efflux pump subunit AcrB